MSNYQGPGRYRHYKGGEYMVIGLGLREESVDKGRFSEGSTGVTCVIYKPLTPGSMLEVRQEEFWLRELSDFNADVGGPLVEESGKQTVPRFEFIGSEAV